MADIELDWDEIEDDMVKEVVSNILETPEINVKIESSIVVQLRVDAVRFYLKLAINQETERDFESAELEMPLNETASEQTEEIVGALKKLKNVGEKVKEMYGMAIDKVGEMSSMAISGEQVTSPITIKKRKEVQRFILIQVAALKRAAQEIAKIKDGAANPQSIRMEAASLYETIEDIIRSMLGAHEVQKRLIQLLEL